MIYKRLNLSKYFGILLIYVALTWSDSINFTIGQYIPFVIGVFLVSIEKEVTE